MRITLFALAATGLLTLAQPAAAQSVSVVVASPGVTRGADYWGPYHAGSPWQSSWGNPASFASRWGFDEYSPHRGWRRDTIWYAHPSQWAGWGGWNWVFQISDHNRRDDWRDDRGRGRGHHHHRGHDRAYGWNQPVTRCYEERTTDWIRGRRAVVTYVMCIDPYGRRYEQSGSRRIERWIW